MLRNGICAVKRDGVQPLRVSACVECLLRRARHAIDMGVIWIPTCVFFATSSGDSMRNAAPPACCARRVRARVAAIPINPSLARRKNHDVTPILLPSRVVVRVFRVRSFHRSRHQAAPRIAVTAMSRVVPIRSCRPLPDFRCRAAHVCAACAMARRSPFSSNGNLHGQFHAIPGRAHHVVRLRHHLDRR